MEVSIASRLNAAFRDVGGFAICQHSLMSTDAADQFQQVTMQHRASDPVGPNFFFVVTKLSLANSGWLDSWMCGAVVVFLFQRFPAKFPGAGAALNVNLHKTIQPTKGPSLAQATRVDRC